MTREHAKAAGQGFMGEQIEVTEQQILQVGVQNKCLLGGAKP
jgi:hypothetical protein